MTKLGKLNKVDLRQGWKHEAHGFTRWMAHPEHFALLCDELDIEVEDVRREEAVGRFNVDILAKEAGTGRIVIVENQLEVTDHKHLGQLITYAAGHNASIIIWVVADYREEHERAVDWFNQNMPEAISFFLVKLELWSIDGSLPAPRFNVISRPNYWGKVVQAAARGSGSSTRRLLYQEFWEALKAYGTSRKVSIPLSHKASPQHWYNISIGTSKAHIALTVNSTKKRVGCELYIHDGEELFVVLERDKSSIERELPGLPLEWRELPGRAASRIITLFNGDPTDQEQWPTYFEWLLSTAERFNKVFRKRLTE